MGLANSARNPSPVVLISLPWCPPSPCRHRACPGDPDQGRSASLSEMPGTRPGMTKSQIARAASLLRRNPSDHKIHHLLQRRAGLLRALGDDLRVEEADHGGEHAERGGLDFALLELT